MPVKDLVFGSFRLSEEDSSLWRGAERLEVAPKTFALLQFLVRRAGRLVTKEELLAGVWPEAHVSEGVLKVRVRELRLLLEDDAEAPRFIATVHRRGYRFVAPVSEPRSPGPATAAPSPGGGSGATAATPIGREAEMAQLEAALRAANAGERRLLFVSGEPGIGKTATVDAFADSLGDGEVLVARGQCLEHHGSGEAYLPVLEALGQLTRGPSAAAVVQVLRRVAPTWLTQLPWLLESSDREVLQRELLGTTRERMLREMAEAVEALCARSPLVLILEDLHWSDPSTLDLLALLAHRRHPAKLLVLATYRPVDVILSGHPLRGLRQRLEEQGLAAEIRLPFLRVEDVERFVARHLGVRAVPRALCAAIVERTAGNPLFVVSLVKHLCARGWLAADAERGAAHVSDEALRADVPEGLRQMIERQLEALPAAEARALEAAAVVGEDFPTAAVAAALGEGVDAVEALCEAAVRRQHVLRAAGIAELPGRAFCGRYAFLHALHRDVLYRRIGESRRLELHRRIGEWQETTGAGPAEVARHFLEAAAVGCAEKAERYSIRAAERARSLLAYAEAARHTENALRALAHRADAGDVARAELMIALGEAQERSGALGAARETFAAAVELARAADAPRVLAAAALGMGRGHHVVTDLDERLIALLEEALERMGPADDPLRACLLARLDTALSPLPRAHERSERLGREALAMARRLGDPEALLDVLQFMRWGFAGRGTAADLRASAAELAELARNAASREQALRFQLLRIADLNELGATDEAAAALAHFRAMAEDAAVPWFSWFAVRLETLRALQEGRLVDAERLAHDAVAFAERMDHPNVRPVFRAHTLSLRLLRGRFDELVPRVRAYVAQHPGQASSRATLAYVLARAGDLGAARGEIERLAADDFGAVPRDSLWLTTLAYLAEACADVGDRKRAARLLELLAPYGDRVIGVGPSIASAGHGARYLGRLAATLGREDEALALLETARVEHERMGARPWLAFTLCDRARVRLRSAARGRARAAARASARADLEGAAALGREVGMEGLLREIAALEG